MTKATSSDPHVPPLEAMFVIAQCKEDDILLVRTRRTILNSRTDKQRTLYPASQVCLPHLRWFVSGKNPNLTIEDIERLLWHDLQGDKLRVVRRLPRERQCWTCCRQAKTARRKARAAARREAKDG